MFYQMSKRSKDQREFAIQLGGNHLTLISNSYFSQGFLCKKSCHLHEIKYYFVIWIYSYDDKYIFACYIQSINRNF